MLSNFKLTNDFRSHDDLLLADEDNDDDLKLIRRKSYYTIRNIEINFSCKDTTILKQA